MCTSWHWTHRHIRQAFLLVALRDCFIFSFIYLTDPSRVSGVTLTKTVENGTSAAALRVTWTTPQSDRNISQYEVQYRTGTSWNSATPISISLPATSTILTGLDPGTEYNIRVRAVSELGAGEWSVEQTERTFDSEFLCIVSCCKVHLYTFCYMTQWLSHSVHVALLCCTCTPAPLFHSNTSLTVPYKIKS